MVSDHKGTTTNQPPGHVPLPHEPQSPAELLAVSHLFSVELTALSATAWAKGTDGLEHRRQTMDFRLLERFKGDLDVKAGGPIHVVVTQNRETGMMESDYHGLWSHAEVEKGGHYLVFAKGGGHDAAALMQEPAINDLRPEALTSDVRAALAAEQVFAASHGDPGARLNAAVKLVESAYAERARVRGLFGQYVWARVEPEYATGEDRLYPLLIKIVAAKDATVDLRQSLIDGLYPKVTENGAANARAVDLAHALLGLLLQPEAAPLMEGLTQAQLYNLIFDNKDAPISPAPAVIPDPAARAAMKAALAKYRSQRANAIAAWLGK